MRFCQSLILLACVFWCFPIDSAQGQLIRINNNGFGGVNIRAPFVRINTSPYGNTHVRAPFVNINSPPAYYPRRPYYYQPYGNYAPGYVTPSQPVYGAPVQPGTAPAMVPGNQPTAVPGQVTPSQNAPIPAHAPEPTPVKPANFEADSPEPTAAPALNSVLQRQPVTLEQVQDLRLRLIDSSRALNSSLAQYSNGTTWQDHLQLPSIVENEAAWSNPAAINQEQRAQLAQTLERFNKNSAREDLYLINQFDSYKRVHQELSQLVQFLSGQTSEELEELPAPRQSPNDK